MLGIVFLLKQSKFLNLFKVKTKYKLGVICPFYNCKGLVIIITGITKIINKRYHKNIKRFKNLGINLRNMSKISIPDYKITSVKGYCVLIDVKMQYWKDVKPP